MDELPCTALDTKCGKPAQIQTQIRNQIQTQIQTQIQNQMQRKVKKICELLAEVQQYISPEQCALNEIN